MLEPTSLFNRMDRLFDQWFRTMPGAAPFALNWDRLAEDVIRVDQYHDNDTLVIRAELAGIDPDNDVELTIEGGMLRIDAHRRVEQESEDKGYLRHELRYGRFTRSLPMPDGVTEDDITASYKDGILEVRVPIPEQPEEQEPKKIAITKH